MSKANSPDWQENFIATNLLAIGFNAWNGYLKCDSGAVVCSTNSPLINAFGEMQRMGRIPTSIHPLDRRKNMSRLIQPKKEAYWFLVKKTDSSRFIYSNFVLNSELSQLNLWQIVWKFISNSNWWQLCLIAVGSASSIIYPHIPLVGFAAVTGNTLTRKKALISAISIWLTNQVYGFTMRQYPRTFESLTWGLVMGLGMLLITCLVTLRPKFSRHNFQGYLIWLVVSLVGSYAIYQGSIILIAQFMGGHKFSTVILWHIFVRDTVWAFFLSAIHCSLVWLVIQTLPQYKRLSFPPTYQSGYRPPGCGRKV